MFPLENTFLLLVNSVGSIPASEFLIKCKEAGMVEKPFDINGSLLLLESDEFDKGCAFSFTIDDNELAELHIAIKNETICRTAIQITYRIDNFASLFFPKVKKHYKKVILLADKYYGGKEDDTCHRRHIESVKFKNGRTICLISQARYGHIDYLNIDVISVAFEEILYKLVGWVEERSPT